MIRLQESDIGRRVKEYSLCSCEYCRIPTRGRLYSFDNETETLRYVRDPLATLESWRKYAAYEAKYEFTFFDDEEGEAE